MTHLNNIDYYIFSLYNITFEIKFGLLLRNPWKSHWNPQNPRVNPWHSLDSDSLIHGSLTRICILANPSKPISMLHGYGFRQVVWMTLNLSMGYPCHSLWAYSSWIHSLNVNHTCWQFLTFSGHRSETENVKALWPVAEVTPVTVKWQEGSYDTRGIQLTGLTKVDSLKKLLRRQCVLLY